MRQIGTIRGEAAARAFAEFLVAKGIRNQVEHDTDGTWLVWIYEDDQLPAAQGWLARFQADPNAPEFRGAAAEAAKVRKAQAEDLEAYRKRIRTRRSMFPKIGGYGAGILTYLLLVVCVLVAVRSNFGKDTEFLRRFFISDPLSGKSGFLPEVRDGQVWRLLTPIFLHFNIAHLLFNSLWLYQLGCMIEARQSSLKLFTLVVVIGALSNVAQYFFGSWFHLQHMTFFVGALGSVFGGMSGVVYGLAGYVWIRGKYDPGSGLGLDQQSVNIMLIWLVLCFTPVLNTGNTRIANGAHLSGLILGVVWGRLSAWFAPRRPE